MLQSFATSKLFCLECQVKLSQSMLIYKVYKVYIQLIYYLVSNLVPPIGVRGWRDTEIVFLAARLVVQFCLREPTEARTRLLNNRI